jgi:hypothetical protein
MKFKFKKVVTSAKQLRSFIYEQLEKGSYKIKTKMQVNEKVSFVLIFSSFFKDSFVKKSHC